MGKHKKKKPEIRFKGFTDDWEQRKLGEIVNFYNGDRSSRYPNDDDIVSDGLPFINAGDLVLGSVKLDTANKITEKKYNELSGAKIKYGDIIYCLRGSIGKSAFVDNFNAGTIASSLVDIRPKKIEGQYLFQVLNSNIEYQQRTVNDEGAAQPNMSVQNLSLFDIPMPSRGEQNKIALCFYNLDNLITLHQRKLEKLKKVKKSMLEKMFPQNGEMEPQIRFCGFNSTWEQRKLGEICDSFEYGLNVAATDYDGENKYIRITDIDDNSHGFLQNDVTSPDIDLSGVENYKLKQGDILFARTGASVGKTYIYKESDGLVYYAGFLIRGRVKDEYSPEFVFQNTLTGNYDRFIRITSQRSGQPGVNAQEYASYQIAIPVLAEQQKLGAYFSHLDHLITLHQRKLEKLKKIKKAMLEKMFV